MGAGHGSKLLLALAALTIGYGNNQYHKQRIAENGTRFNQRVLIDRKAGVEIFHVPAHNGLLELKELYDFSKGLALRCHPKLKACYLAKFDKKNYDSPATLEKNLRKFERRRHSASKEERREVTKNEKLVVMDSNPVNAKARKLLTPRMRKFLGNYELYREEKLPEGAEVIKDDGTPLVGPKRSKRGLSLSSCDSRLSRKCGGNEFPEIKYVKTPGSGRSCEHVWHCPDTGRCYYEHLTHNNYYRCCCCPYHTKSQQCYRRFGMCTYHSYNG